LWNPITYSNLEQLKKNLKKIIKNVLSQFGESKFLLVQNSEENTIIDNETKIYINNKFINNILGKFFFFLLNFLFYLKIGFV
jgi:CRISPR/Cas system-associated protein Cas10 (large subunit of type III CRISPR-Cas system)